MTHDQLVQFAAEKVGGEVCNPTGDELCVKTFFTTIDPARCSSWHIHDLTSPDLFFKGLAVCHHYTELDIFVPQDDPDATVIKLQVGSHMKMCESPSEIPQKFWECWAEVEGI